MLSIAFLFNPLFFQQKWKWARKWAEGRGQTSLRTVSMPVSGEESPVRCDNRSFFVALPWILPPCWTSAEGGGQFTGPWGPHAAFSTEPSWGAQSRAGAYVTLLHCHCDMVCVGCGAEWEKRELCVFLSCGTWLFFSCCTYSWRGLTLGSQRWVRLPEAWS